MDYSSPHITKGDEKNYESSSTGKRHNIDIHEDNNDTNSSMDVDDLVSVISSKLEKLETSDSLDSLVAVFVEVLSCKPQEAAFFLDSVLYCIVCMSLCL